MSEIFALTNLASDHAFALSVESGTDVLTAARDFLEGKEVPEWAKQGFYVSIYPTDRDENAAGAECPTCQSRPGPARGEGEVMPGANLDHF